MSVRVKRFSNTAQQETNPMFGNDTIVQRETTVDGQTFHWADNEVRNFLDDSVGQRHGAFGAKNTREDILPFGSSRS